MAYYRFRPYVPIATRLRQLERNMKRLARRGLVPEPVQIEGRRLARTFWGLAWCRHIEAFHDHSNRLPRGRAYVRNGSVGHLAIRRGRVEAYVQGSDLYHVEARVAELTSDRWEALRSECTGRIGSILDLLQGKLSREVMAVVTDPAGGLFPSSREVRLSCDCPDGARLCKHLAAVLYGVGARLDDRPELLFVLRGVDHEQLIETEVEATVFSAEDASSRLHAEGDRLSEIFGVDIDDSATAEPPAASDAAIGSAPLEEGGSDSPVRRLVAPEVRRLRERFGMSRRVFASLLEVSVSTVRYWETVPRPVRIRPRIREAWTAIEGLSREEAWQVLEAHDPGPSGATY